MYCKHCGKRIDEDSIFCQYCGGVQNIITDSVSKNVSTIETEGTTEIESIADKELSNDTYENVEYKDEIAITNNKHRNEGMSKISILSLFAHLQQEKIIIYCIIYLLFILFATLTVTKHLSVEYVDNYLHLWYGLIAIVGIASLYLVKRLNPKIGLFKFRDHFKHITILFVIIYIIIVSIMGRMVTSNKETKPSIENEVELGSSLLREDSENLKVSIQKIFLSLPMIIDENTSWTDIKLDANMVVCTYRIDDAKIDLYNIDLVEYKEFLSHIPPLSDKHFLKLCYSTEKKINCRIVSQWEPSKFIEITFGTLEIGEIDN